MFKHLNGEKNQLVSYKNILKLLMNNEIYAATL